MVYSVKLFPFVSRPTRVTAVHDFSGSSFGSRRRRAGKREILKWRVTFHICAISFRIVDVPRRPTACTFPSRKLLVRPCILRSEHCQREPPIKCGTVPSVIVKKNAATTYPATCSIPWVGVVEIVVVNFQCSATPWHAFGSVVADLEIEYMIMTQHELHSRITIGYIPYRSGSLFDVIIFG